MLADLNIDEYTLLIIAEHLSARLIDTCNRCSTVNLCLYVCNACIDIHLTLISAVAHVYRHDMHIVALILCYMNTT